MARYRQGLPQLGNQLFLTDGGIETTLIFHEGLDLPYFAAFHLLRTREGTDALRKYFRTYAGLAKKLGAGLILETATWRANPDWAAKLEYSASDLETAQRKSVELLEEVRAEAESPKTQVVLSGCVGPRGDGYVPEAVMTEGEAEAYHTPQVETFASTDADLVCAITMNYTEEAVGVALAAKRAGMPVAISFTVETDGRLPTGQTLKSAIERVDAATSAYPAYYMVNCAHPTHFAEALLAKEPWVARVRGLRANASKMSHAELNEAAELDVGDPSAFGREHAELKRSLAQLTVMGGCCGTDERHVEQIAKACLPLFRAAS